MSDCSFYPDRHCSGCPREGGGKVFHNWPSMPPSGEKLEWISAPFEVHVADVYKKSQAVLVRKHQDYGPENIARAPGGPLMGLAVRLHDKVARLAHLLEKGGDPNFESLEDTFLDICNYGAIGQLVLRGEWPGVERGHGSD